MHIHHWFLFLFLLLLSFAVRGQKTDNSAFAVGEQLTYRIYYSSAIIDATAGEATLTVEEYHNPYSPASDTIQSFHIIGTGKSTGLFNLFYKVRDKFESYLDKKTLLPYVFVRNTSEGNYKRFDFVNFDQNKLTAKTSRKTISIPEKTHDLITAIYFMRTLNVDDFGNDSIYLLNFYLDDSVYYSAIKYMGRDTLKTFEGRLPVIKIAPMMATGEVFASKYPMYVWVTDDKNHIPVLASSKIIVGSIKIKLTGYKNLRTPIIQSVSKAK